MIQYTSNTNVRRETPSWCETTASGNIDPNGYPYYIHTITTTPPA